MFAASAVSCCRSKPSTQARGTSTTGAVSASSACPKPPGPTTRPTRKKCASTRGDGGLRSVATAPSKKKVSNALGRDLRQRRRYRLSHPAIPCDGERGCRLHNPRHQEQDQLLHPLP